MKNKKNSPNRSWLRKPSSCNRIWQKKREVIELEDGIKSMYRWHLKNEV
jgi:hypothetical protein